MSKDYGINLNTYLLGGLFALLGWLLYSVNGIQQQLAASAATDRANEVQLADVRARLAAVEADITKLKVQIATRTD